MDGFEIGDVARLQSLNMRDDHDDGFDNEDFTSRWINENLDTEFEVTIHGFHMSDSVFGSVVPFDAAEQIRSQLIDLDVCDDGHALARLDLKGKDEFLILVVLRFEFVLVFLSHIGKLK